ncbi:hypothetical protein QFZ86_004381 [Pseudomonas plecoglossicida]
MFFSVRNVNASFGISPGPSTVPSRQLVAPPAMPS